MLKRLTNEHYFETYLRESKEGPPRKYYHITAAGIIYLDQLESEWDEFQGKVNEFLKDLKNKKWYTYRYTQWKKVTIRVNPKTRKYIEERI